eukprot:TRINITY_DN12000_c0_g1_i1.p1 TRINITY_DN12000_c0_g1~~TRINITY_DN12000_c0_g1_i1.p1  ORF type:complete len:408 (-),score=98.52 TRINITY_DN12000_c0_g1_i1:163-1386(-)
MGSKAEIVLNASKKGGARSRARGSSARAASPAGPQRVGSRSRAAPESTREERKQKVYSGYVPPKPRKLTTEQIDQMTSRLNKTPKRERVRQLTEQAAEKGFMDSLMVQDSEASVASMSGAKKVSRSQESAIVNRLYTDHHSEHKAERMEILRREALTRELAEVKAAPILSPNTQILTRNMEPFMKRMATQQAEQEERLARKKAEYDEAERSQSTFMPEISLVSHQMERSVDSLMQWQKDREMRNQSKRQESEKKARTDSPFRPRINKKSEQIVRRMSKSTNDGCRTTARVAARKKANPAVQEPEPSFAPTINSRSSRLDMGSEPVFERLYRQTDKISPAPPRESQVTKSGVAQKPAVQESSEQWVVGPPRRKPVGRAASVEMDGPASAYTEQSDQRYKDIYGEIWRD